MNLSKISLLEEIAQRADRTAQERKKHPERFTDPDGIPANKATGQAKPGQVKKHTAHKDKQPQRTDKQPQRKHKDIDSLLSKAESMLQ